MATRTPRRASREMVGLPGLRRSREARGLSQKELERLADVSFVMISRVENGRNTTLETARKLAKGLRVGVEDLRMGDSAFAADLEREIGEGRERYYRHFNGGGGLDPAHEEDLAEAYADLALARGGTKEAIKVVVFEAITDGKQRGMIIAQEERNE